MEYCSLGRSGLQVSRLCLGTGNFGTGGTEKANWGTVGEKEAFQIMDAALDAGINFFDTANVYGGVGHRGYTEEIIGRWFAQGGGRREKTVLATKVGRIMEEDEYDGPNKPEGLSLYKIRRHFEGSLKRLQTDHIELLQMHKVDRRVTWDELWEAFEGLVRQGKLDYVSATRRKRPTFYGPDQRTNTIRPPRQNGRIRNHPRSYRFGNRTDHIQPLSSRSIGHRYATTPVSPHIRCCQKPDGTV